MIEQENRDEEKCSVEFVSFFEPRKNPFFFLKIILHLRLYLLKFSSFLPVAFSFNLLPSTPYIQSLNPLRALSSFTILLHLS